MPLIRAVSLVLFAFLSIARASGASCADHLTSFATSASVEAATDAVETAILALRVRLSDAEFQDLIREISSQGKFDVSEKFSRTRAETMWIASFQLLKSIDRALEFHPKKDLVTKDALARLNQALSAMTEAQDRAQSVIGEAKDISPIKIYSRIDRLVNGKFRQATIHWIDGERALVEYSLDSKKEISFFDFRSSASNPVITSLTASAGPNFQSYELVRLGDGRMVLVSGADSIPAKMFDANNESNLAFVDSLHFSAQFLSSLGKDRLFYSKRKRQIGLIDFSGDPIDLFPNDFFVTHGTGIEKIFSYSDRLHAIPFVANEIGDGITILDTSDLKNPKVIHYASGQLNGYFKNLEPIEQGVFLNENQLVVYTRKQRSLIDLSDLSAPRVLGISSISKNTNIGFVIKVGERAVLEGASQGTLIYSTWNSDGTFRSSELVAFNNDENLFSAAMEYAPGRVLTVGSNLMKVIDIRDSVHPKIHDLIKIFGSFFKVANPSMFQAPNGNILLSSWTGMIVEIDIQKLDDLMDGK